MDPTNQPMSLPLPFEGVAIVDEKLGAKPFEEVPLEVLLPCSGALGQTNQALCKWATLARPLMPNSPPHISLGSSGRPQ